MNLVVPELIQRAYRNSDPSDTSSYISAVQMLAGAQNYNSVNGEQVGMGTAGEMFFSGLPASFFQTEGSVSAPYLQRARRVKRTNNFNG